MMSLAVRADATCYAEAVQPEPASPMPSTNRDTRNMARKAASLPAQAVSRMPPSSITDEASRLPHLRPMMSARAADSGNQAVARKGRAGLRQVCCAASSATCTPCLRCHVVAATWSCTCPPAKKPSASMPRMMPQTCGMGAGRSLPTGMSDRPCILAASTAHLPRSTAHAGPILASTYVTASAALWLQLYGGTPPKQCGMSRAKNGLILLRTTGRWHAVVQECSATHVMAAGQCTGLQASST